MRTICIVIMLLLVPIISACQPLQVPLSGTYDVAGPPIERTAIPVGDDCLINIMLPYWFEGVIQGTAEVHLGILGKGPCEEMAPGVFDEVIASKGTFNGVVDGKEGSFDFIYTLTAKAGEPFEGLISIIPGSGTGELVGVRADLIARGSLSSDEPGTYEGGYYFAP